MSDIVPPSLGLGGGITQTTPAGIVGTVTNPPRAMAQLPSGDIVHGTVIRLDLPYFKAMEGLSQAEADQVDLAQLVEILPPAA